MASKNLLQFSPRGSHLAHFAPRTGRISVYDLSQQSSQAPCFTEAKEIHSIDFHPLRQQIVAALPSSLIVYGFLQDSKMLSKETYEVKSGDKVISPLLVKYSPDGDSLVVYGTLEEEKVLCLLAANEDYKLVSLFKVDASLTVIQWNLRGDIVLTASHTGVLNIYKVSHNTIQPVKSISLSTSSLSCMLYDDENIVVGTRDGNVLVIDTKTLTCIRTLLSDINSPISSVSMKVIKGCKVLAVTYAQGSKVPTKFILMEDQDSKPILESLKTDSTRNNEAFESAMSDYILQNETVGPNTIVGEFSLKLLDYDASNTNEQGDGVRFQPKETKSKLGTIFFVTTEGKVALRNLSDILREYWSLRLKDKIAEIEKKSIHTATQPRRPVTSPVNNRQQPARTQQPQKQQKQPQQQQQPQKQQPGLGQNSNRSRQPQHANQRQRFQSNSNQRGEKREHDSSDYGYDRSKRQHRH